MLGGTRSRGGRRGKEGTSGNCNEGQMVGQSRIGRIGGQWGGRAQNGSEDH